MAESSQKFQAKKFQAPKGTRDFYPADLAVRRHIESVWRQVSINHGFEEIDGPTFEHLDLYTHKSGPGIVSELFQVMSGKDAEQLAAIRSGGAAPYALRPEFTPTLARMVAARAPELPRPIKWFAIPSHFRAESPQRGRLREFMQWNVDFIGDDSPRADAEVIATAINSMEALGLVSSMVRVHIFDRRLSEAKAAAMGIEGEKYIGLLWIMDNFGKLSEERLRAEFNKHQLRSEDIEKALAYAQLTARVRAAGPLTTETARELGFTVEMAAPVHETLRHLDSMGYGGWCEFDPGIVRGLAYYTGTVFEIHEASGAERAIAGGGRYDNLIESFGGPKLPACGFGMGDVVLANILKDKGLLKPPEEYLPRPDAFVIAANDDVAARVPAIVADLRRQNLHVRQSYKTTRNVGKLLGDAGKCRARYAVILGAELNATPPRVALKDMDSGEQREIPLSELAGALRAPAGIPPSLEGGG
jgi:histidyl-tRNA synthetase